MTIASGATYWDTLLPGVIVALLASCLLPWLDRANASARTAAVAVCIALSWRYMAWRLTSTIPPIDEPLDFSVGLFFAAVELLALIGTTATLVFMSRTRSRSGDADRNMQWLLTLPVLPRIAVLICTYNEDEEILERTIVGALHIDYPNYRVWVCDDGRRPKLKRLCEQHGCGYLTRDDNRHAKAGNINNALRHLSTLADRPEFVAILDADFVPKPAFLARTLSLMREDDVGVVQTPQHFFNPDPIQTNLSMTRVWPDEQRYFFDVAMPSKDAWGGAFCCGTSSLIRFEPLMRLGGFPTDSVTEDYLVTLRLAERGYRTVYLNELLSVGLAPEGLREYIGQRGRWALGFMQIFRGPSAPWRLTNHLPLVHRLMLVEAFLYWTTSFGFRIVALIIPMLYLLFDVQAVYANVEEALSYFAPYFIAQVAVVAWISSGRVLPIMSDLSQLISADHVLKCVAVGLFKPSGHKFRVTQKGLSRGSTFVQWQQFRGFALYLVLTVAGILWAFTINDARPLAEASFIALAWSWYNIIVLLLACIVSIETVERRRGHRLRVNRTALLTTGQREAPYAVADISVTGMRLIGTPPGSVGTAVQVKLENLDVEASVVRLCKDGFALRFGLETAPDARRALIRHVYGSGSSDSVGTVHPAAVAGAVFSRLLG